MNFNIATKAACILFSRVVLRKLEYGPKKYFRSMEKSFIKYEKLMADLSFLTY